MIAPSMVDAVSAFLFGNLWRTAALVLAVVAGWKALQLDGARQALAIAEGRAEIAEGSEKLTAAAWELSHLQLQGDLASCQAQWVEAVDTGNRLVADALREALDARLTLEMFEKRWAAKTSQCGAMLIEMERACPELADY